MVSPPVTASRLEDGKGLLSRWKEPEIVGEEDPGDSGGQMPFFHALCLFRLKEYEGWHCPGGKMAGQFILDKQISDHIDTAPGEACH